VAAPTDWSTNPPSSNKQPRGHSTLIAIALALLLAWLVGTLALNLGTTVHILLLAGLMLLLVGALKARDAAKDGTPPQSKK